jgi:hypothetical protein
MTEAAYAMGTAANPEGTAFSFFEQNIFGTRGFYRGPNCQYIAFALPGITLVLPALLEHVSQH